MSVVEGWNLKTPPGFIFTAKIPRSITHEKVLVNCDEDLNNFLKTMSVLGPATVKLFSDLWNTKT